MIININIYFQQVRNNKQYIAKADKAYPGHIEVLLRTKGSKWVCDNCSLSQVHQLYHCLKCFKS